jgi:flagellar basal body-associated protein FliL
MNQDINPPTPYQSPQTPQGPNPAPAPEAPEPQPAPQVIQAQSGPKKSKLKTILLALLVLLLVAAVAGAYLYQQGKVDDATTAQAAADKKVASLQSQLTAAESKASTTKTTSTTPAADYTVVTGNVVSQAAGTASVNTLYKPTIKEIWLEYGTTPDALSVASKHVIDELGAGDANSYGQQNFSLTSLKAGQNYFYRVAAKSAAGTTIYGGVASFTAAK